MMHQAAVSLGVPTRFLAENSDDPAAQVSPDVTIGSARSANDLRNFGRSCAVMTFEHEVVDLDGIATVDCLVRPSPAALAVVADKLSMRAAVAAAGAPGPPHVAATSVEAISAARADWGRIVVKLARGGYDGRGVFIDPSDAVVAELVTRSPLLVEPMVPFRRELAVIVARRPAPADGGLAEVAVYDPVHTVQHDGQCAEVRAGEVDAATALAAQRIATQLAERLDIVGLLAVELFQLDDGPLLVNELAVRPHNTGHHTIDACVTSQFENHLRAVCDLPLGATALRSPAVMVNIVGNDNGDDPRDYLAPALAAHRDARIHLYGKHARPQRKVGHVTVCADSLDIAAERAWQVVEALHGSMDAAPNRRRQ
jgi:5-(carboxyamino)imidazole ribonucleotide synthase